MPRAREVINSYFPPLVVLTGDEVVQMLMDLSDNRLVDNFLASHFPIVPGSMPVGTLLPSECAYKLMI
jgi:hypothetical protein